RIADIVGFTGFSQVEGEPRVNPNNCTDERLATQIENVRSHAGERFHRLELNTLVQGVAITTDRRRVAEQLQPLLPTLTVDAVLSSPYSLIGTPDQIADQLRERRERLGISYITVFETDTENM